MRFETDETGRDNHFQGGQKEDNRGQMQSDNASQNQLDCFSLWLPVKKKRIRSASAVRHTVFLSSSHRFSKTVTPELDVSWEKVLFVTPISEDRHTVNRTPSHF